MVFSSDLWWVICEVFDLNKYFTKN
jgi:hypothetical protein